MPLRSTDEVWQLLIAENPGCWPEGKDTYRGPCPIPDHDDTSGDSFYFSKIEKGIGLYCQGCNRSGHEIAYQFGVSKTELFYEQYRTGGNEKKSKKGRKPKGKLVTTYPYHAASGELLYRIARYETEDGKKDFRAQSQGKDGEWKNTIRGIERVLYRLPELIAADKSEFVYIVEGEKKVDALRELGFVATCNPGGAGKWRAEFNQYLKDRNLVPMPDEGEAGESHVATIAEQNAEYATSLRVLRLPDLPPKGDVVDWLAAGGTADQLRQLTADCPAYDPANEKPAIITNYSETGDGREPLPINRILSDIDRATDNWPKRIGRMLFVPHEIDGFHFINSEAELFGWLGTTTPYPPKFGHGAGMHTKREVFSQLQLAVKPYNQIEMYPHEPQIEGHYYCQTTPEPGSGYRLDEFVDFFAPATPEDRSLIKAMVVTFFWGGRGGKRPLFVITSDHGRGVGKSIFTETISHLCGGVIGVSSNEKMEDIKKRLLSEEGIRKRVVLLDNVKSSRFSWAELESIITAKEISGWRLYKGEGVRPNTITWAITLNGPSFSTDIADRAVIIKIIRTKESLSWTRKVETFADTYRQEIIADCVAFLRSDGGSLKRHSRWSDWEQAMLHRLPQGDDIQQVIHDRRGESDSEAEEGSEIEGHFHDKLFSLGYAPKGEQVWIPNGVAAKWVSEAIGQRKTTTASSQILKQKITEGEIENLSIFRKPGGRRGYLWSDPVISADAPIDYTIEDRIENQKNQKDWP